jgi:DNA-binding transcriptional ArsR family regulator
MAADPLSRVFSALADPTRRDIVARLAVGDATVNELAAPYDVTVQAPQGARGRRPGQP